MQGDDLFLFSSSQLELVIGGRYSSFDSFFLNVSLV